MAWENHDEKTIRNFINNYCNEKDYKIIKLEPWREGASNAIWEFDFNDTKSVLKVGKLENRRRQFVECDIIKKEHGLNTPLLYDFGVASKKMPWDWSILERVDGEHPFTLNNEDAYKLGQTITEIRKRVNSSYLDKGDWRSFVEERIKGSLEIAYDSLHSNIKNRIDSINNLLEKNKQIGEQLDALPVGIVHGDVTPLNLIRKKNSDFCLIDWEHPRLGSIVWDITNIRKAFRLDYDTFISLLEGTGSVFDENIILFASALYEYHVASWRAEMWFGHGKRDYGDLFLIEMGEEIGRAELMLNSIRY